MLAGIGGCSIHQAKQNLSYDEYLAWMAYREKHGPLNLRPYIEHGLAMTAYTTAATIPRKPGSRAPQYDDFRLVRVKPSAEPIALEEAMRTWR